MTTKIKMKSRYEAYKESKGVENLLPTMTDQTEAQEAEIYAMIEKYGIQSLMQKSKNEEPLYLDLTQINNLTLDEHHRMKKEIDAYFENMPAKARKLFGDNSETFYHKYLNGDFEDMVKVNALSEEQAAYITNERNKIKENEISTIKNNLKEEILKEMQNQTTTEREVINE